MFKKKIKSQAIRQGIFMNENSPHDIKLNTKSINQKTAKFKKPLHVNKDENIWLLVSLENERLSGEMLFSFFELMARHSQNEKNIQKIKVIISDFLNRHYRGREASEKMGNNWLTTNESTLKNAKIPVEVVFWRDLMNEESLKREKLLRELYETNTEYQTVINKLASSHARKSDKESAMNYLFEECAVISSLHGHICYPSDELNEALKISINHFKSNIQYHGYFIYDGHKKEVNKKNATHSLEKSNNNCKYNEKFFLSIEPNKQNAELSFYFSGFCNNLEKCGIFGEKNQVGFFNELIKLKEKYASVPVTTEYDNQSEKKLEICNSISF